jgi:hypothetical protein
LNQNCIETQFWIWSNWWIILLNGEWIHGFWYKLVLFYVVILIPTRFCSWINVRQLQIVGNWWWSLRISNFDPYNRSLKFRESTGTPSPQVGIALRVWGFIPSHFLTLPGVCDVTPGLPLTLTPGHPLGLTPGLPLSLTLGLPFGLTPGLPFGLTPRLSFGPHLCNSLCLGREPKARVVTLSPTRRRGQYPHWHLDFLSTIAIAFFWILGHQMPTPCGRTLPQANLGVPKLPTLSWQVQGSLNRNPPLLCQRPN